MMFVLMIVGVLTTLVLPNYRSSQLKAQSADVLGRIEAITIAIKAYEADHQTLAPFTGPVGRPPEALAPYADARTFAGPSAITFQLAKTDLLSPPTLIVFANGESESQILLAAAGALGDRVAVVGSGHTITILMAD